MFPIPSLYLKLAGAAIVAVAIGLHIWSDRRTEQKLSEVQAELIHAQTQIRDLEQQLIAATQDKQKFDLAAQEAEAERAKIKGELDVTLKKLRSQKPPTECKAAIDWAIQNRHDLNWEAK